MAISSINRNVTTLNITASATVGLDVDQVLADASSGSITVTLNTDPGDGAFRELVVQKTDSGANAVTVTDGTFTFSLAAQNDSVICQMTAGGDWIGVSGFDPSGTGDVEGPSSATADAPAIFSGTSGKIIKNSVPTGSGVPVLATSPTLVTPNIGVATGTSLAATGALSSASPTAGIGYATGAGGAVTQATNRTTGVTLNTVTGAITLISAAGSATPASFTVTNSAVAATDVVIVNQKSGTDLYEIFVTAVGAGSFRITSFTTGGTTTEQPVFNFSVIKGVAA